MVAVMSENYNFETTRDEILLEDLKDIPLIIYRRFEKILLEEFQNLGIEPNVFCINDDARTTILWAGAGLGIGIVPKSVINFGLMDNIKYKEINNITLRTQISAIWIKERYLSMAAKKFLEFFT
jgi:DNA-binding transcriptional LysR family regulator